MGLPIDPCLCGPGCEAKVFGGPPREEREDAATSAWNAVAAFFDGAALLRRDVFIDLLLPLYNRDRSYVEGLWNQFQRSPFGFCRYRRPEEPGRTLFAACLALGTDYSAIKAQEAVADV